MSMTASEIAAELGLRRAGGHGWSGDCPACGYRNRLRLNEIEGRALWWCASCQDKAALTAAVTGRAPRVEPRDGGSVHTGTDNAARTAKAIKLWDARYPLLGSAAEHYLGTRGLTPPDGAALGYLRDAWHLSGQRAGCMIALATDAAGEGQAVHRTYLAAGGAGKSALDPPRATLGPVGGGVVRLTLWKAGQPLVIGEGIETSLSAGLIFGAPAWAALSAGNMARVPLPGGLRDLVIAADPDEPGQRAAWTAAAGFLAAGLRVRVATPDTPGEDFNDLLQRQTAQAVPNG